MRNFHFSLRALIAGTCLLVALGQPVIAQEDQLRQQAVQQPANPEAQLKLANHLLERMRKAWAQRDPNASGPDFQQQSDALQARAQELVTLYEKVLALQPRNVEALVNLAEVNFVFLSAFDQAEALLKRALETDPADSRALVAMAEFQFFFKNDREGALARLTQALQQKPHDPALTISLADLLSGASTKAEDFARARALLEAALVQHPGHNALGYMLASVWYREASLTQPLDAAKAETALELFLAELEAKPELELYLEVAQIAQAMGRLPQARHLAEQGMKAYPEEPRLPLLLGDLWLQQGATTLDQGQLPPEAEKAESYYRPLLKPDQLSGLVMAQQVQLFYNLGLLAYLRGEAVKSSPQKALPFYQESVQMYRQAMDIFDRINIINRPLQQDLGKTLEAIGKIHLGQSSQAQAIDYYKQACDLKLESSCNWLKQQGLGN